MKRDWKLYDRLMRIESGLGWDSVRKTINATPEWWVEKIQADSELAKFRDKSLEMYQMYYEPLFRDSVAIGDRTKTPFQLQNENSPNKDEDEVAFVNIEGKEGSDEETLGDDVEISFPESSSTKRKKAQSNSHTRSKKGKDTATSSFEVKLDTVLQVLSSRSSQASPPLNHVPSISECMDIVSTFPGFEPSSSSYNKALRIFWKKEARESFIYPPSAPRGSKETFKYYHSSLRNVIERTFGVSKARWAILKDMHVNYSYDTQVNIVIASMALHNYIRMKGVFDEAFDQAQHETYHPTRDFDSVASTSSNGTHEDPNTRRRNDDLYMKIVRDRIARDLMQSN